VTKKIRGERKNEKQHIAQNNRT